MTTFISHRVNTLTELEATPTEYGVEIDLRDHGDRIILSHDPYCGGEDFEDYLAHYKHGPMILNVKSERIEHRILDMVRAHGIEDFFFLDSTFPMIIQLSGLGEHRLAVRYSEFESLDTILAVKDRVEWVWVDCFSRFPLTRETYDTLKECDLKLCLVSPELQGRPEDILGYKDKLQANAMVFDAICTKLHNIPLWRSSPS